jgi:hypothetical protein
MTETMLPLRELHCPEPAPAAERTRRHRPDPATVDSGYNAELEWQFGTCWRCDQLISRFRSRFDGLWFDGWGSIPDTEFVFDRQGPST